MNELLTKLQSELKLRKYPLHQELQLHLEFQLQLQLELQLQYRYI